jgi:MoaA/NifB/PqqE/SkfB family radical SAM enzyme
MTPPRLLWKFIWNFGWKGMWSVQRFIRESKHGATFPAFIFISVTDRCNLRCQGCWVRPVGKPHDMDPRLLDEIIVQCKGQGSYFFGILGGEPLMHHGLLDVLARHPDCYFLVFTNGTVLDARAAAQMRQLGNVSPLVSIEGREATSDERRGGTDVYARTLQGLELCRKNRLIFGVATSVCKSNIRELATEAFIRECADKGAMYVWYYIYRPVGPDPNPDLSLSDAEIKQLRQFLVDIRMKAPLLVVDAYWDHNGGGLCPAATGISHHINPHGYLEPCPPLQVAAEQFAMGEDLKAVFRDSKFLAEFREVATATSRGCILLERPELIVELKQKYDAADSSGRDTIVEELEKMNVLPSHAMAGREIPERSWFYRFAKKNWFFGFGAYG